jgi:hypothetical protein
MAYEMRPGQGSAFRNERKETEQHADFTGRVMLPDGTTCWLDVWKKRKQNSEVFVSVRVRPMEQRPAQTAGERTYDPPPQRSVPSKIPGDDPDSIPFTPEF